MITAGKFIRLARFALTAAALCAGISAGPVYAQQEDLLSESAPPRTRESLEYVPRLNTFTDEEGLPFDIRGDAIREAALSYGARGGLSWRTYAIRKELETRASYLDKVYDFRQLLIPAPSGLLIEPPVISEQENAMIIDAGGQEAAVADRRYEININARIVSTARTWRNYLERDWGAVTDPPDILRPNNEEERDRWIDWVREGWDKGIEQAEEIFQDDLNQLMADYRGMVRYRMLLAQGMVTPPYALQVDRGITTEASNVMRVGDRAIQITGKPEFTPGAEKWQPASR